MEENQRQNFDSPWKDIIATYPIAKLLDYEDRIKELELSFHEQLIKIDKANKMEYITTAERIGIQKGRL